MGTGTGQYRIGTGDAVLGIYTGVVVETACGVFRLSCKLFDTMREWVKSHSPDPVRERLVQHYEPSIGVVYDALSAMGCKPGTVRKYAAVAGELMAWSKGHLSGDLTPEDLTAFMDDLVSRGRESAEQHFGEHWDPHGRGIRRLAYYALKKVLGECFNMELMDSLPPPCRPERMAANSLETVTALTAAAQDDRERLLLLLINGLNLQPHEAACLTWNELDANWGAPAVSRERRARKLLISRDQQRALDACYKRASGSDYVFASKRGNEVAPVSVRTLQNVLRRLVERSGVQEYVTLTSLRKGPAAVPPGKHTGLSPEVLSSCAAEAPPLLAAKRLDRPAGRPAQEPAAAGGLLKVGDWAWEWEWFMEKSRVAPPIPPTPFAPGQDPMQIRIGAALPGPTEQIPGTRRSNRRKDRQERSPDQQGQRKPRRGKSTAGG